MPLRSVIADSNLVPGRYTRSAFNGTVSEGYVPVSPPTPTVDIVTDDNGNQVVDDDGNRVVP